MYHKIAPAQPTSDSTSPNPYNKSDKILDTFGDKEEKELETERDETVINQHQLNHKKKILKLKKIYNILFYSYFPIAFIVSLILMALASQGLQKENNLLKNSGYSYSESMNKLWKFPYITDIKLVNSTTECGNGYELASIYKWPGTNDLCSCVIVQNLTTIERVSNNKCSGSSTNCYNINGIPEKVMRLWRGKMGFCIKKGESSFYSEDDNCPEARRCGWDKGNGVCVKSGEKCPITEIKVASAGGAIAGAEETGIDGIYSYYVKRDLAKLSLILLKISEFDFCRDLSLVNISPNKNDYKFLNKKRSQCLHDTSFQTIDEIGEEEYFKINDQFSLYKQLPAYPRFSNEFSWKFGAKPYNFYSFK